MGPIIYVPDVKNGESIAKGLAGASETWWPLAPESPRESRVESPEALPPYRRLCRKLERRGIQRRPSEGPRDYCARVCRERPELAQRVQRLTELYIQLRYAGNRADARVFSQAVAQFQP